MSVEMVASETLLYIFYNEGKGELSRTMLDMTKVLCIVTVFTHGQVQCFINRRLLLFGFVNDGAHGMWRVLPSMCVSDFYGI